MAGIVRIEERPDGSVMFWLDHQGFTVYTPDVDEDAESVRQHTAYYRDMLEKAFARLNGARAPAVARLQQALADAIELAEEGTGYTNQYYRDRWSMDERIAALKAVLEGGP